MIAEGKNIRIDFDNTLKSKVFACFDGTLVSVGDYTCSEYLTLSTGADVTEYHAGEYSIQDAEGLSGKGKRYKISGRSENFRKEVNILIYDKYPSTAFFKTTYTNISNDIISIESWTSNQYRITAGKPDGSLSPFWAYQGGSYDERPAWVNPLSKGFRQNNYMGMNTCDYGGGTPVSDIWRKDIGIAVGHSETVPKLTSLPVSMPEDTYAELGIKLVVNRELKPGESLETLETFVTVHRGDYYQALTEYRSFMIDKGITFRDIPDTAYEPTWCAWGYEKDFTLEQIYNTLPMIKKMGIKWVCVDYGWLTLEGDFDLDKKKFPNGEEDMKAFVHRLHAEGFKAQLWCIPLAADPASKLYQEHPDYFITNDQGQNQFITFFDCYYLCPASQKVIGYTKSWLKKILVDWDFDGLKMDGPNLNAAPPCYNPEHHHEYPEESFESVPAFFKTVYDTALKFKPDAFLMFCPCGETYSFFTMPYYNVPVASDPESSWQVRSKGKTFKALMGPSTAYHGDHVELSDNKNDFASTVGIGGVIDTKFTWPAGVSPDPDTYLDNEKEKEWKKWIDIYREKALPKGTYLGDIYSFGFDTPEAHAIKKDGSIFYAFYSDDWNGNIELRGLDDRKYLVYDYVENRSLGSVSGPKAKLRVSFKKHLLIEAKPI